jgi:DNA polymerase III epsilon subunit family exonuclease
MERPLNLISDSSLVQEVFDLARQGDGRAGFVQIAEAVLCLINSTEDLAKAVVQDLIENDPRFQVHGNELVIADDDIDTRSLNEIDFVVVDVEAIGTRSSPTRVIEIGACRVRGGEITDEYETLLNPGVPLPRFIAELTGINAEMLKAAPTFAHVADPWLSFAGDSVLVAHNSSFDFTLLNQEINRVFPGCRMRNADLCTVQLARRVFPNLENHNLDALADHCGVEITQRHRAAGDARATARILLRLLDELEIYGARTLAEARDFRIPKQRVRQELELAFNS